MPGVTNAFTADTWEQIRVKLVYAFDAANGNITHDGVIYPNLSNAQALALLQALRGQLRAFKIEPSAEWSLWFELLGYRKPGDKFDLSLAHGAEAVANARNWPGGVELVAGVWEFAADAAKRLDYVGAPKLLVLNYSYNGYEKAAADAYAALERARARAKAKAKPKAKLPVPPGITPPDVELPEPPDVPLPTIPTPDTGGIAILALLLLAAIATRRKRN